MSEAQELAVRQKQELANKEEKTIPGRHFIPPADIFETDEALTVIMEMPGVEKKNVSIALENDLLHVEGQIDFSDYNGSGLHGIQPRALRTRVHTLGQGRPR
jgi:HSP20 family protein